MPTNPNFNSENRSSGLENGKQKINAIADDELHNLILNWSRTDNISLKIMSELSSELWCIFLPSQEILIQVTEVEKLNKTENEREKK